MICYLVQFGRSGFVGRFTSSALLERGARVIVRGPRGVEPGVVLCEPDEPFAVSLAAEGEVIRIAMVEDEARIAAFSARESELLAVANECVAERELPLTFVDAELTLDDRLILHGLAWNACDATPLFAELSSRFNLSVRLLDISQTAVTHDPKQSAGCGKPDCGSGEGSCSSCGTESSDAKGGCSTGSCSRGKVKSADELTAYFADLRQKMEAARTPLY